MDWLDLAFLVVFRTRRDAAQIIRRYGVVNFRRTLRGYYQTRQFAIMNIQSIERDPVAEIMGDVLALEETTRRRMSGYVSPYRR